MVIRFGRFPVSKRATTFMAQADAVNIVVDPYETRDYNSATDLLLRCTPLDFSQSLLVGLRGVERETMLGDRQRQFAYEWVRANDAAAARIDAVERRR